MGFILKTNGRKLRSGAKIQAKIVTEDKKSFMKVPYEFLIQIKELSNKEKVLRDAQQVASLLDAANNVQDNEYTIRGNVIQQITSLTNQTGSYGSWIDKPLFTQYNNQTYINRDDGRILQKPKYNPLSPTNSIPITMTINVHIGEGENYEETNIIRTIRIPSYDPNQIIGGYIGQSMLIEGNIWNFIRKSNIKQDRVFDKLKTTSQSDLQSDFNSHFTFTIDGETKHLNDVLDGELRIGFEYPTISFTRYNESTDSNEPINFSNSEWSDGYRPTAIEACRLLDGTDTNDGGMYQIVPVKNTDLTATERTVILADHDDPTGLYDNVVAYSIYYSDAQNIPCKAKITCSLNGPDNSPISGEFSLPIKYLSGLVNYERVLNNVEQSGMLSWFLAPAYFDPTYSFLTESDNVSLFRSTVSGTPGPAIFNLIKTDGYNLVLRVPTSVSSLHVNGCNNDYIQDYNNTGYEIKNNGTVVGFSTTKDMFYYELKLSTPCKVYASSNYVPPITGDVEPSVPFVTNTALTSVFVGNNDNNTTTPKYLFIANDDLVVGDITGEFAIHMKANALTSGNTGQVAYVINYHFKIVIS